MIVHVPDLVLAGSSPCDGDARALPGPAPYSARSPQSGVRTLHRAPRHEHCSTLVVVTGQRPRSTHRLTTGGRCVVCSTNQLSTYGRSGSDERCDRRGRGRSRRGGRPALPGVLGPGRPHPARHRGPAGRRRRHRQRAGRALRRVGPGRLQAPQGARGRRPGQPPPGRPAPPRPPRSGGVRPHDQVDRALPAPGRGALPPPRRRPARPCPTTSTPTPPTPHEQEHRR